MSEPKVKHVDLEYPGASDNETHIRIGLLHVRAADDIRIHYDFERDGYVIEQASYFGPWEVGAPADMDWQEVAFVKAWGRERPQQEKP
jgi:hypothetical protein